MSDFRLILLTSHKQKVGFAVNVAKEYLSFYEFNLLHFRKTGGGGGTLDFLDPPPMFFIGFVGGRYYL